MDEEDSIYVYKGRKSLTYAFYTSHFACNKCYLNINTCVVRKTREVSHPTLT